MMLRQWWVAGNSVEPPSYVPDEALPFGDPVEDDVAPPARALRPDGDDRHPSVILLV